MEKKLFEEKNVYSILSKKPDLKKGKCRYKKVEKSDRCCFPSLPACEELRDNETAAKKITIANLIRGGRLHTGKSFPNLIKSN